MGTKVQCKTFLPIYCSMREHNSETSNDWPIFYEDLPRSMQFHDSSTSRCIDGFLEYDKLVLKQTMLKHEAIFRTQVFELHRLYGRQKEMMDELKRQAQCNFDLDARTSQSSATSPNMLQVDAANVWERSSEISVSISKPSIPSFDDPPHSFDGINGTEVQNGSLSKTTNVLKNDERVKAKIEKVSKILIDLQLPADAYIDTEDAGPDDTEGAGRSLFQPRNVSANGDVDSGHHLTCNIGYLGNKEVQKSDSRLQHGSGSLNIADLNEPVKDPCFEEICTSASSILERKESLYERNQDSQLMLESCSSPQIYSNISEDLQNGGGFSTVFQDTVRLQKRLRLPLSKRENGNIDCNRSSSLQNSFPEAPENLSHFEQFIPTRSDDLSSSYLSKQNHPEKLFREKTSCHNNLSGRNQTPGKMFSATASSQTYGSLSIPADLRIGPRTSNLNFPWEKPVCDLDMPTNVEEFTSLRGTVTGKIASSSLDPSLWKSDYLPHQRFDSEIIYHSNGYLDKLHFASNLSSDVKLPKISFDKSNLYSAKNTTNLFDDLDAQKCSVRGLHGIDLKIRKNLNLNQATPNDFPEQVAHKVSEANKSSPGIPWLSGNSSTKKSFDLNQAVETEIDFESSSKVTGTEASLPRESHRSTIGPGIFMDSNVSRVQKDIPENPEQNKILEASIVDAIHDAEHGLHSIGFSAKARYLDLEKAVNEDQSINDDDIGCRYSIDLNFVASSINHLKSSGNASDAEVRVLLKPSVSKVSGRCTGIDLELPAETLTQLIPAEETHAHDLSTPKPIINQKEDVNINEISPSTAAEVIISMSTKSSGCVLRSNPLPDPSDSSDLVWFAGVITSQIGLLSDGAFSSSVYEGENCANSDVDGMDFFEAMTLRLTEPKLENLLFRIPETENHDENDGKFSSLLLAKPRRGQARKRRQKRDFQKDVLPGLASLSWQEVTEDLQTIGGMMRASGHDWQSSTTRRNSGRGGRGRRQPNRRATDTVMVDAPVELPPPKEPNIVELEMEGMSIMGWGSTRRCRRPRCPPGNITSQAFT